MPEVLSVLLACFASLIIFHWLKLKRHKAKGGKPGVYKSIFIHLYLILFSFTLLAFEPDEIAGTLIIIINTFLIISLMRSFIKKDVLHSSELANINVKSVVKNLFTSDELKTAFVTSLPKGNTDNKYGLDFIPFMLKSAEIKWDEYKQSSNRWLTVTIVLGIFFSLIVMFAGYIIIDTESSGIYRRISKMEKSIYKIEQTANSRGSLYYIEFLKGPKKQIEKIVNNHSNSKDSTIQAFVKKLNSNASTSKIDNLDAILNNYIFDVRKRIHSNTKEEDLIYDQLLILEEEVRIFKETIRKSNDEISRLVNNVNNEIDTAKENLYTGNSITAETIKRFTLSLVFCTFFLAILRYVARIYTTHHNEMIKAQNMSDNIRRFYVAFKASGDCADTRKEILKDLMSAPHFDPTAPINKSKNDIANSANNDDLVKMLTEGLSLLSKRV